MDTEASMAIKPVAGKRKAKAVAPSSDEASTITAKPAKIAKATKKALQVAVELPEPEKPAEIVQEASTVLPAVIARGGCDRVTRKGGRR